MISDWTDAYANTPHIPGGADFPAYWSTQAALFRTEMATGGRLRADIAYGSSERHRLDLFLPESQPRGLVVFVHGGFWVAFDKLTWSHWAEGAVRAGWAVATPSYTLAPEARISTITREISQAINHAATLVQGPIRLAGHSAGGHLVTRMICTDSPLNPQTLSRIAHVLSISGLHDLRPLRRAAVNGKLRLDADEARHESPALLDPISDIGVTCWVGSEERPEFIRQNKLLANIWTGCGVKIRECQDSGRHHYDICASLSDASSPLTHALTGDDGWA
ncbi:Alpha/beta hydrolase fold-3 [Rhabdaerophilaceae bacterium]